MNNFSFKKFLLTTIITTAITSFITFTITFIIALIMNVTTTSLTTIYNNSLTNNTKYESIENVFDLTSDNESDFNKTKEQFKTIYEQKEINEDIVLSYYFYKTFSSTSELICNIYIYTLIIGILLGNIIYFVFIEKNKLKDILLKSIIAIGIIIILLFVSSSIYNIIVNNMINNYYNINTVLFNNIKFNYLKIFLISIFIVLVILIINYIYKKTLVNKLNSKLKEE